ncbi:MAG: FHA domain-containing protein [Chloroflexi bacterium]|nr:FHA domain-containing protein [Chloroflexota bacterium]
MARVLIVLKGKLIGQAHLNKPALTIGCMAGNDIEIPYTGVSRLHAKILAEQGSWVIEDAGSMNGVMYQGERVKRVTLCNRACVYLAPGLALHYEVASSPL